MAENSTDVNESNDDRKLTHHFNDGWNKYKNIERSSEPMSSETYQSEVKDAIAILERATRMVSELCLFSLNEEFEELSTKNIRYLLLPWLLGNLIQKRNTANRLDILNSAETYYRNFLDLCKSYNVTEFELPNKCKENSSETTPTIEDLSRNREVKIRRYKERKQQEELLKEIEPKITTDPNIDEEVERKYYVTLLQNSISKTIDEMDNVNMERSMLSEINNQKGKSDFSKESSERLKTKPFKPIIITRNELQKQVYGLGYPSIATMTIDEFYEQRLKKDSGGGGGGSMEHTQSLLTQAMAGISREEGKEADAIAAEIAAEKDDVQVLKHARAWDDWKDDHRRGEGNRKNRS